MSNIKGPIIVLDDNSDGSKHLIESFQSIGQGCLSANNMDAVQDLCSDPLNQPVVLFSQQAPSVDSQDIERLSQFFSCYLVVIAFCAQDKGKEADYFRLGAADIIEPDTEPQDLKKILDRLGELADTRRQQHQYSTQLEKANNELQESLRHLEQDQKAGLEIQKNLMPESPLNCGNFEISHSIAPSLYLSGDCVGYHFVLDRYLLFYFADVSGHGASSAFISVLLHFMVGRVIRRHAREKEYKALAQAPEGLVESINQQLLNTGLDKHLTIVAGSLDTETRQLRYVVGAHQPSPILIADGAARFLPGKGKPAGIFKDVEWTVEQITVPEQFAFVLLSDGVYELLSGEQIADKEASLLSHLNNNSEDIGALKQALSIDDIKDPQDDISVFLLTGGF
ncbi:MAG: serine/threonine-protein phosphatase [Porticoccaceae bacterium]|nr:serine/threonine-protein phosphatase [Porticoccaceae bacterium]